MPGLLIWQLLFSLIIFFSYSEVDPDVEVRRFAVLQVEAEVAFVVARLERVDVAADVAADTDDELRAVVARALRQVEIILEARAEEPHPGDAISIILSEIQSLAV